MISTRRWFRSARERTYHNSQGFYCGKVESEAEIELLFTTDAPNIVSRTRDKSTREVDSRIQLSFIVCLMRRNGPGSACNAVAKFRVVSI